MQHYLPVSYIDKERCSALQNRQSAIMSANYTLLVTSLIFNCQMPQKPSGKTPEGNPHQQQATRSSQITPEKDA